MKTKLFKRLTAAALALLMVAASVPSDSDFVGVRQRDRKAHYQRLGCDV